MQARQALRACGAGSSSFAGAAHARLRAAAPPHARGLSTTVRAALDVAEAPAAAGNAPRETARERRAFKPRVSVRELLVGAALRCAHLFDRTAAPRAAAFVPTRCLHGTPPASRPRMRRAPSRQRSCRAGFEPAVRRLAFQPQPRTHPRPAADRRRRAGGGG